jgi:hypothetical protein
MNAEVPVGVLSNSKPHDQIFEFINEIERARIFFVVPGSMKFALERSQKSLHFVHRGRILLRCGSAFALSLPSLGVSSLDLGRLFIQAALFSLVRTTVAAAEVFRRPRRIQDYFSELLIEVNLSLRFVPRPFTTAIIASEMPAAIRPYSIAVAPDSSARNLRTFCFNFNLQPV